MPDVLLTGAEGQLGREVARRVAGRGLSLRAMPRRELDVTDRDGVLHAVSELGPLVVVNAAAYTAVDMAESEPEKAYAVNRDGPAHLAEGCAQANAVLLHVSTDYVFDGTKPAAYVEDDPVAPLGVYGASKLAGEEAVRKTLPRHVILRTAWLYGVDGKNFVRTMLRVGATRDHLRVVADQRGSPTYAGDLAEVLLGIAEHIVRGAVPPDGWGTFHAAGRGQTTWHGFARRIFKIAEPRLGRMPAVEAISSAEYPTPASRPTNSVLDCGRLERIHGIRLRPWQDALAEMLEIALTREPESHPDRGAP